MSIPVAQIKCNRCALQWNTAQGSGVKYYQLDDGRRVYISSCLAWCYQCKGFKDCEIIPALNDLLMQLHRAVAEIEPLWSVKPKGFIFRKPDALIYAERKVSDAKAAVDWRMARQSPARCLKCASHFIERLPYREQPVEHPECGGMMVMVDDDMRLAFRHSVKLYSPEGLMIENAVDL